MKEKLYNYLPDFFQNLMITFKNVKAYKIQYGVNSVKVINTTI